MPYRGAASEVLHPPGDAVDDIRDFDVADFELRRPAGVDGLLIRGARPCANHNGHHIAPLVAASCQAATEWTTFRAGDQQNRSRHRRPMTQISEPPCCWRIAD